MTSRVGIAVPVYNTDASFLREAVESALQQSIPVDVVVVDDGSTESGTRQILSELYVGGCVALSRCAPVPAWCHAESESNRSRTRRAHRRAATYSSPARPCLGAWAW